MKRFIIRIGLAAALLLTLVSAVAYGQIQNRLGVDDDVFTIYARARVLPLNPDNLATADSLYAIGSQRNDYKIKSLALVLAFPAQFARGEYEDMDASIEEINEIYESHPDINDIYYSAQFSYCQFLMAINSQQKAFQSARSTVKKAETTETDYGKMVAYRGLAYVYENRNNLTKAVEYYKLAVEHCEKTDASPLEMATINVMIAHDLTQMGRVEEAEHFIRLVEPYADGSVQIHCLYLFVKAQMAYEKKDVDDFLKCHDALLSYPNTKFAIDEETLKVLTVKRNLLTGNYAEAESQAFRVKEELLRHSLLLETYQKSQYYQGASAEFDRILNIRDSLSVLIQDEDVATMDAELQNARIRSEADAERSNLMKILFLTVALAMFLAMLVALTYSAREKKHNLELKASNSALQTAREIVEEAFDEAKKANQVEARFIQNMSHELRTPLNAVLGFSQMLGLPDDAISNEERLEYSNYISDNALLLLTIVNDMISVADVERGEFSIQYSPVAIGEVCDKVMRSVEHRVNPDVKLVVDNKLTEGFAINTDVTRVQQILMNLLTNACKNTHKGAITLGCSLREDGAVIFSVTDTGRGIGAEHRPHIFDRFYKVDPNVQGAGLGLHTCRSIAECLGGKVWLDDEYNTGARFYFVVPDHVGQ